MGGFIGGVSGDGEILQLTKEEIEENCIHIFRDVEENELTIKSKCIRCGKERIYNKK